MSLKSPATNSGACSIWLLVSNKDCEPLVAAIAPLRDFLAMAYVSKPNDVSLKSDPRDGLLPLFLVEHEGREERFYSEKERLDYFAAHNLTVDPESRSQVPRQI